MRFLAAAVSLLLAAPALATPLQVRDANTSQNDMASAIVFAAEADGCSLIQCAGVIASAGCIAAGIAVAQPEVVLGCIAGGAGTICPCAACVDALNDFLTQFGLCSAE